MNIYILLLLAVINLVTFVVYGVDKSKAQKGAWRIPEDVLMLLAIAGGGIGAFVGMRFWHHKTRKAKFKFGIPVILVTELSLCLYFLSSNIIK